MFLFIVIVIIAIIIFVNVKNSKKRNAAFEEFTKLKDAFILNNQLTISKSNYFNNKKMINLLIIDESNEKVVYLQSPYTDVSLAGKIFDFSEVLKCEVFQNNAVYLVEEKGFISDKINKKEKIKRMGIRITFNNMSFPLLEIPFITSEVSPTSKSGLSLINDVQTWASLIEVIIQRGRNSQ